MLKTDTRQANWRRANPGKYEAHLAVQRAVKQVNSTRKAAKFAASKRLMLITINTTSL